MGAISPNETAAPHSHLCQPSGFQVLFFDSSLGRVLLRYCHIVSRRVKSVCRFSGNVFLFPVNYRPASGDNGKHFPSQWPMKIKSHEENWAQRRCGVPKVDAVITLTSFTVVPAQIGSAVVKQQVYFLFSPLWSIQICQKCTLFYPICPKW